MTPEEFVLTLVAEMEAEDSTGWVDQLLAQARAKVTSGAGEMAMINSATVNGKTFQKSIRFTAIEVISACRQALNIYNETDSSVPATYADFRHIQR